MKTAYELAMERLNQQAPTIRLSEDQKREIAALESLYRAKVAERELALKGEITKAATAGDAAQVEQLEQQLASERRKLQHELEDRKAKVRQG
jgi:septin family protein